MVTRAQLERRLFDAATALGLRGTRRRNYIDSALEAAFPRQRRTPKNRPALLSPQANPRPRRTRKSPPRHRNPVTPKVSERQMRVIKAIQLFQRFHLGEPQFVDEIELDFHKEMLLVGRCVAIEYDTKRGGKAERYRHEFSGKSRPILASSFDGSQLYFVGGAYDFTERGIVDR